MGSTNPRGPALLTCEDQTLLVGRNALLVLDFGLHILDGVGGLHLKSDGLASQSLHEDLHGVVGWLLKRALRNDCVVLKSIRKALASWVPMISSKAITCTLEIVKYPIE